MGAGILTLEKGAERCHGGRRHHIAAGEVMNPQDASQDPCAISRELKS